VTCPIENSRLLYHSPRSDFDRVRIRIHMKEQFSNIIDSSAILFGDSPALRHNAKMLTYGALAKSVTRFSRGLANIGINRHDRVAILAGKRFEYVTSVFGTAAAGGVFVPINTLLKSEQIAYILADCDVSVLVTTTDRCRDLLAVLDGCPNLHHIVAIGSGDLPEDPRVQVVPWTEMLSDERSPAPVKVIGSDMASIMYTSGSTGKPKGVILSHLNLLVGASSVAGYIGNRPSDVILAALPFSFDAGLSQLTTGLYSGACVILHDYFLPGDVVRIVQRESVTGITGVPPLWIQLAEQSWPKGSTDSVRYFANTGGKMPKSVLDRLRGIFPAAEPFLMYGLTESFRSTYLPPAEVDKRPESIGKAIPNAEILVVTEDGSLAEAGEVGELVHRGPLVSLGYWNDHKRSAARFRPAPGQPAEIPNQELAVWSGDFVRKDEEGYLYFVGRKDDMIKTSGYRVSPSEVEEVVYESGLVSEVVALGLPDDRLGQIIVLVAKAGDDHEQPTDQVIAYMQKKLPNYMIPSRVLWQDALPRNANGKLDRPLMAKQIEEGGVQE
jgi:acyl-CoA ligase (AMP-forming) (exosortase A-associated)